MQTELEERLSQVQEELKKLEEPSDNIDQSASSSRSDPQAKSTFPLQNPSHVETQAGDSVKNSTDDSVHPEPCESKAGIKTLQAAVSEKNTTNTDEINSSSTVQQIAKGQHEGEDLERIWSSPAV